MMKLRYHYNHTWIGENPRPTRKLADQLTATAMEEAIGLPDWVNSSVTKNQGIDPGPEYHT